MEIEIKLCGEPARAQALKAAVVRGASSRVRLVAHYFDTPTGRLAQAKAALRVRLEGDRWVQTAKVIAQGPMVRLEHNVDLGPAQGDAVPAPDWQRHAGSPVAEVLAPLLQGQALQPTHGTEVDRITRQVRSGHSRIELALDQGRIVATDADGQRRETPVAELELELVHGHVADLHALAARWMRRHGLWLDTRSKAERGEALRAGLTQWAPVPLPDWRPEAEPSGRPTPWQLQQSALRSALAHVLPNLDAVASGNFAPVHVRHAQQSLETLQLVWRQLGPLAPGMGEAAAGQAVAQAIVRFNAWRDDWADAGSGRAPLDAALCARGLQPDRTTVPTLPEAARQALMQAVRDPDLQASLLAWMVRAAQTEPSAGGAAAAASSHPESAAPDWHGALTAKAENAQGASAKTARLHLMNEVVRLHKRIRQSGKVWTHLTLAQRQGLRQRCWRLGVLLTWVWPLLGGGAQSRLLAYWQLLQRLQTALQAFADASLAAQRAEGLLSSEAVWFERGYWQAELQWLHTLCQRDLRRLKPFWD